MNLWDTRLPYVGTFWKAELATTPSLSPSPRVSVQKRHRVHVQNVPVYARTTRTCRNTCARVAGIHGTFRMYTWRRFESTHGGFQRATPRHTPHHTTPHHTTPHHTTPHHTTPHHTTHKETHTATHNNTHHITRRKRDRLRGREREKKTETEREETTKEKMRQEKTR